MPLIFPHLKKGSFSRQNSVTFRYNVADMIDSFMILSDISTIKEVLCKV